ncbi:MAG: hypothetical protein L3J82_06575, partial [Planctomycetes bacterium]|nr:hypothetical protein [Planctomycetota bacterium]
MDRGVKVAIFVASIASLGLGLIWDQVLTEAREAVKTETADVMGPEIKKGEIGSPDLKRKDIIKEGSKQMPLVVVVDDTAEKPAEPVKPKVKEWMEYTVQNNDSWGKIAHSHFKGRGL